MVFGFGNVVLRISNKARLPANQTNCFPPLLSADSRRICYALARGTPCAFGIAKPLRADLQPAE
jgi:hypothetical protein